MIQKLVLKNFRSFQDATLTFQSDLNVLVGDNTASYGSLARFYVAVTRARNSLAIAVAADTSNVFDLPAWTPTQAERGSQ